MNKSIKIVIGILVIIIFIGGIIFAIDYINNNNFENEANKNEEIINNYELSYLLEIKENGKKEKQKITVNELANKYDYDIYYYGIESCIIEINNEKMDLKEALKNDKVTMEQIINQAEKDSEAGVIVSDMYKEGGTMIYFYDTYTIIKCHSTNGNRDVYIGIPKMRLNDVR